MVFDNDFLDSLSRQAKASERLRQHYDLRNSENDNSQRMLNALEPGTIIKIHKHPLASTFTLVLRGKVVIHIYNNHGELGKDIVLSHNGNMACTVSANEWHNLECLEPDTVIFEQKDIKYDSETDAVFFDFPI